MAPLGSQKLERRNDMIEKRELLEIARDQKVIPSTIEKDYVIGWLLAGMYCVSDIAETWLFKGGTCIKKCYLQDYRFSEDLDFTLRNTDIIDIDRVKKVLEQSCTWVQEMAGIVMPLNKINLTPHTNKFGHLSVQGRIYYGGPLAKRSMKSWPRIKIDLTCNECIVNPLERKKILHQYSDQEDIQNPVNCYSFIELYSEKIRALGERGRPRDLYDVVNLSRIVRESDIANFVKSSLEQKCDFKGIPLTQIEHVEKHYTDCAGGWRQQLSHQINFLPEFEDYWNALPEIFSKLK